MKLRRAHESDAVTVLHWRNDPHAVAMCQSAQAVDPMDHYKWFQARLVDPDCIMFIATQGTRSIGVIRFDRDGDGWRVNINVRPDERGKGYGAAILKSGILRIGDHAGAVPLRATIRPDNVASLRIFERCGFQRVGEGDGCFHYVRH